MRSITSSPNSMRMDSILPRPMPCSPVQVPPIFERALHHALVEAPGFVELGRVFGIDQVARDGSYRRRRGRRGGIGIDAMSHVRGRARRIRPGVRSARRRRWTPRRRRAQLQRTRSRRRGAPATAGCALRAGRPFEIEAAVLAGDRLHGFRLFLHGCLRSMKFEEQQSAHRGSSSCLYWLIASDCLRRRDVATRDRHTDLDGLDDGVGTAIHLEHADGSGHGFGQGCRRTSDFGDDAERAFAIPTNRRVRS